MYRIITEYEAQEQIAALPTGLLPHYAEVLDVLMLKPWNGEPYHRSKPDGAMRRILFGPNGRAAVIHLVVEDQQRVDVLRVYWL